MLCSVAGTTTLDREWNNISYILDLKKENKET